MCIRDRLYPHAGTLQQGGVVEEGYLLNNPLALTKVEASAEGALPEQLSLVETDRAGFLVTALKVSEDGDAIALRLYEAHGTRGKAKIKIGLPVSEVSRADMLERPTEALAFDTESKTVELEVKPFEIVTLHLRK